MSKKLTENYVGELQELDPESAQIRRQQVREILMLLLDPDADSNEQSGAIKMLRGCKAPRP